MRRYAKALRAFALALPDAVEEFPWGDCVAKVNKKIFAFLPDGDTKDARLAVKLHGPAHEHALSLDGATPTAYGLGRAGWVTIWLASVDVPTALLQDFIDESYTLIAPKRSIAKLRR
jgi:predicted DNA-binding protein (MmcQ/YjbR family)